MLVSLLKRCGIKLSLNDPRWGHKPDGDHKAQEGRRPGEGPPDLDQLWRDFNARLNRIFGGRNNGGDGGGGPGGRGEMRGAGIGAGVVAVIVGLIWLASGAFIVQEGQTGVVTTFGKLSHTTGAGFNWRWPYPIQAHETVNVSTIRTAEIGYRANVRNKQPQESLMLTDDENIIDIQFAVQYTLKDPVQWLFNNRENDETVRQVAETAIREVVGKSKMDFVLYEGREKVAADVHQMMQQILDSYQAGVRVQGVSIKQASAPSQLADDFNAVTAAQQEAVGNLNNARSYSQQVIARAQGEAAAFNQVYEQYRLAPEVTRRRMYYETMEAVLARTDKTIVETPGVTPYLPLDRARRLPEPGAEAPTSGTPATPAPAQGGQR